MYDSIREFEFMISLESWATFSGVDSHSGQVATIYDDTASDIQVIQCAGNHNHLFGRSKNQELIPSRFARPHGNTLEIGNIILQTAALNI